MRVASSRWLPTWADAPCHKAECTMALTDDDSIRQAEQYRMLFSELEGTLRRILKVEDRVPFGGVIDRALEKLPSLRTNGRVLWDLATLRNVIAHGNERIGRAIPTEESVAELRQLLAKVRGKARNVGTFFKPIREFNANGALAEALVYMHANDYSQIAVRRRDRVTVLTAINVAEWLAGKVEDDLISLRDHVIEGVLEHARGRQYSLVSRTATLAEVENEFLKAAEDEYQNLFCVLVTHSGLDTEKLLGIVTPWDLMHIPPTV